MTTLYATCSSDHYDSTTNQCTQVQWLTDAQGLLPSLTYQDSLALGTIILGIFATAFGFKILRKFLFK